MVDLSKKPKISKLQYNLDKNSKLVEPRPKEISENEKSSKTQHFNQ